MKELDRLWGEWIRVHSVMRRLAADHASFPYPSSPFFSSDSGDHNSPHRLLFVGQATSGPWHREAFDKHISAEALSSIVISERQQLNRKFVDDAEGSSGFWIAFRAISDALSQRPLDYSNSLWSNLIKIGSLKGNPKGEVLSFQKNLAVRTLKAEINAYEPTIVVFATGKYASDVVREVTDTNDSDWGKSLHRPIEKQHVDQDLWWIPRRDSSPAYLWTAHPSRGVSIARRNLWVSAALRLSEGKPPLI